MSEPWAPTSYTKVADENASDLDWLNNWRRSSRHMSAAESWSNGKYNQEGRPRTSVTVEREKILQFLLCQLPALQVSSLAKAFQLSILSHTLGLERFRKSRTVQLENLSSQTKGKVWASIYSLFLTQVEAQNIPMIVHQHQF